ncbi:hypothetical protein KBB12_00490 [Candidatus Woesebacteria bacterium]|nr:hypothetical protein [Candidatus Woesebacteria bacterium]
MKKKLLRLVVSFFLLTVLYSSNSGSVYALDFFDYVKLSVTPIPCSGNDMIACPNTEIDPAVGPRGNFANFYTTADGPNDPSYNDFKQTLDPSFPSEFCASTYEPLPTPPAVNNRPFTSDPRTLHFWAEDSEITDLGKAVDRSRQFVFWTLMRPAIDQSISLKQIWSMNRNIALGFMILVSAVLGLAIALSLRLRSGYKFSMQSAILKIGLSILYIALSATIVFTLIALSDIIMRFFIESLGGNRVFNTYFGSTSNEANYVGFVGCRDLNIRVQEAAKTEMFVLKVSIITNYMMGIMFILRKIILWFLLLVSPFLPLLLSFPLIRNTGRIWIGVFFQWLFYGPLFALFFGATAKLFADGIPFVFDFSRIEKAVGYIFPTAIIITYGGPAQQLNGLNNGNYIDTFAEYIITLVLWWAATWFPWWLLRIFRDDCCDGIYAIKNALYGYFDKPTKPSPSTPPPPHTPKFELPPPEPMQTRPETRSRDTKGQKVSAVRLENFNTVRQAKTNDIVASLNLQATTLKDVAKLETNKTLITTAKQNLAMLTNPLTAQTAADRQKFLNLRTELFTRASTKNDTFAQYVLSTTARSSQQYINKRNEIAKSMDSVINNITKQKTINVVQSVSQSTYAPITTSSQMSLSEVNSVVNNQQSIESIVNRTKVESSKIKEILQTYAQTAGRPISKVVDQIVTSSQVTKEKVQDVLREAISIVNTDKIVETTNRVVTNIIGNQSALQSISAGAGTTLVTTKQVLVTYLQHLNSSFNEVIERIAENTSVSKEKIRAVLKETYSVVMRAHNVQRIAHSVQADKTHVTEMLGQIDTFVATSKQKVGETVVELAHSAESQVSVLKRVFADTAVANYTKKLLRKSTSDTQLISLIQQTTGLSKKQVEETVTNLSNAPTITDVATLDRLQKDAGVSTEKALQIVHEAVKHSQVATSVVAPSDQQDSEITQMLEQQLETVLNPESQIDQTIPLPEEEQSLEEYQEIRQLWIEQYRTGEVPLSEEVHNRLEWIEQDVAVITDILTKLISKDENMRQQALDEVGFILPVFLMNNLSGLQLITYLKAKVSAAKEVRVELRQKQSEQLDEDNLEEVTRMAGPTEENTKHLEVDELGESRTAEETGE